jgi:predicted nucleic acid-binding protein
MTVVSDSTPLICLSAVADLHLLRDLFGTVTIPDAVFHEVVTAGMGRPGSREVETAAGVWIRVEERLPTAATARIMEQQKLQLGEAQAIELGLALKAELLLLDEQRAVAFARSAGLTIMRTGTVYAAAKRSGLIDSVGGRLEAARGGVLAARARLSSDPQGLWRVLTLKGGGSAGSVLGKTWP